ncbi:HPr family phosphocarrier protein [Corynebacterium sputi]|uniref:HPr family phosphocarrier protein n=1 Tax=Corynebacterium sputi TaxID=489915 RepID=UPI00041B2BE5|nr:HPr family phosphocarrier protein [Corynebacterium sputi]
MASTTVTVGSTVGLHARPATVIADAAAEYDDEILLELVDAEDDDIEPADAASSLMIMALGAEHGDTITITSDNAEAVEKIAALVAKNLDEE